MGTDTRQPEQQGDTSEGAGPPNRSCFYSTSRPSQRGITIFRCGCQDFRASSQTLKKGPFSTLTSYTLLPQTCNLIIAPGTGAQITSLCSFQEDPTFPELTCKPYGLLLLCMAFVWTVPEGKRWQYVSEAVSVSPWALIHVSIMMPVTSN